MPEAVESNLKGIRRLIAWLRGLLAASAVLPLIVMALVASQNYRQVMEDADRVVQRTVDILAEHTLKVFETEELILDRIEGRLAGLGWDEIDRSAEITPFLRSLEAGRGQVVSIWLIDADGYVRNASVPWQPALNGADRDYVAVHRERADAGTFVGSAYTGRTTGAPSFGLSRRRSRPADGGFDGVIAISVSAGYFQSFFRSVIPEPDHVAILFRADGQVLARDPPATAMPVQIAPSARLGRAIRDAETGVLWQVSPVDGVERLVGYRRIAGYPLYVAFGMAAPVVLAPWYDALLVYGAGIGAAGIVLFFATLLALRHTRREALALHRLLGEMRRRTETEAALRQAQKMEAVGQLTGGLAHDFNNFLTVIAGSLERLDGICADVPKAARPLSHALQGVEGAANVVRQLLAFSRQQQPQRETLDLNEVVRGIADLLRQALPSHIEFQLDLSDDLLRTVADRNQLETALLNLVVNARDAMPEGGRLTIVTRNCTVAADAAAGSLDGPDKAVAAADLAPGGYVGLAVTDTGHGMLPEVLQHVFKPFFTTKGPERGTGLGLSMVDDFARRSGGGLTIRSAPGRGTTIRVLLPCEIAAAAESPASMRKAASAR
ncbi:MAG TPA: ATP-binding protein [Stellaceae bacterium]